ncbi:MAG: hypothetical protein P9F75_21685 [Candidatus Contendobacter sp.]|nr:hypothetical protein [Candidatus Contendobacter sp.]
MTMDGKRLDIMTHMEDLTQFVGDSARGGLPAHELERGVWTRPLQLGHDLEAAYFAWPASWTA